MCSFLLKQYYASQSVFSEEGNNVKFGMYNTIDTREFSGEACATCVHQTYPLFVRKFSLKCKYLCESIVVDSINHSGICCSKPLGQIFNSCFMIKGNINHLYFFIRSQFPWRITELKQFKYRERSNLI